MIGMLITKTPIEMLNFVHNPVTDKLDIQYVLFYFIVQEFNGLE